jgi:hypothetical protein
MGRTFVMGGVDRWTDYCDDVTCDDVVSTVMMHEVNDMNLG